MHVYVQITWKKTGRRNMFAPTVGPVCRFFHSAAPAVVFHTASDSQDTLGSLSKQGAKWELRDRVSECELNGKYRASLIEGEASNRCFLLFYVVFACYTQFIWFLHSSIYLPAGIPLFPIKYTDVTVNRSSGNKSTINRVTAVICCPLFSSFCSSPSPPCLSPAGIQRLPRGGVCLCD